MENRDYNDIDEVEFDDEDIENNIPNQKNYNSIKENPMNSLQFKSNGAKQKRRSKNDYKGRDYHCGCGKTYLSYPALYTHIKTKHNGKTPDGTNANQIHNKIKGRGRPRKNFLINEDTTRKRGMLEENALEELHPELKKLYGKDSFIMKSYKQRENVYFNVYTYISEYFDIDYTKYTFKEVFDTNKIENDPDYKILFNKIEYWEHKINNLAKTYKLTTTNKVSELFQLLSESSKSNSLNSILDNEEEININKLKCDDVFALFMLDYQESLVINLMKLYLIFFYNLRKYLNKFGWDFILEIEGQVNNYATKLDFTKDQKPFLMPELVKDFLKLYIPIHCPKFRIFYASVFSNHFCDFLIKNNLTTLELNLLKTTNNFNENENDDEYKSESNYIKKNLFAGNENGTEADYSEMGSYQNKMKASNIDDSIRFNENRDYDNTNSEDYEYSNKGNNMMNIDDI